MKIKELRKVANSEILFQKELKELKKEIKKSRNPKLYIDSIREEMKKERELVYELDSFHIRDSFYISSVNSLCTCVLTQFLEDTYKTYQCKLKSVNMMSKKEKLEKKKQNIEKEYITHIYEMFEDGFGTHTYDRDGELNEEFIEKINIILSILHTQIIEELVNVKPHIFIAHSNGNCAVATTLSIVLDQESFYKNEELELEKLFLTLVNVIVECSLVRLFKLILNGYHILKLQEQYEVNDIDELKIKVGQSIANKLVDDTIDDGLKLLKKIVKESNNICSEI